MNSAVLKIHGCVYLNVTIQMTGLRFGIYSLHLLTPSSDGDIFKPCLSHNWGSEMYTYICVAQTEKGKGSKIFSGVKRETIKRQGFHDEGIQEFLNSEILSPMGQRGVDIFSQVQNDSR